MTPAALDRLRAWGLFLGGFAFIIATLEIASEMSSFLRSRGYLWQTVKTIFVAVGGASLYLLVVGARITRPTIYLRSLPFLVAFAYAAMTLRSSPAERFHFIEYGTLCFIALRAITLDVGGWRAYVVAGTLTLIASGLDELAQHASPTRVGTWEDVEMNAYAIVLATLLFASLFGNDPAQSRLRYLAIPCDREETEPA